eukprot:109937-Karenia_brevis.AAC.1
MDAKSESEYFSGASDDDAKTSETEQVGTAKGLKRKMLSNQNLLQRATNLPEIPKIQLPRDPSETLPPHGMYTHRADHE